MQTCIAFIRGINVGGKHSVPMKWLTGELESAGLQEVRTYIQSGNVVFRSAHSDLRDLADRIGRTIEAGRGFRPRVLVMPRRDLQRAVDENPFPQAEKEPKTLHLYFLESRPETPDLQRLDAVKAEREDYWLTDSVFYLFAPDGIGRSKLAERVEKALGVPATARNWRTVNKVLAMGAELPDA